jgi:hypothetical protein
MRAQILRDRLVWTSALPAGLGGAALIGRSAFLAALLPVLLMPWLLLAIERGYLAGRRLRHLRRRRATRTERLDRSPGPATKPPLDYPGVLRLDPALERSLGDPVDHQGRLRGKGIRLAAIPLLAVLMLACQAVLLPEGGAVAVGLVAAECTALLMMLTMIWSDREPTRQWVTSRIRRELLRRETYLIVAGVGPYLSTPGHETERIRDARITMLVRAGRGRLLQFAALADLGADAIEQHWSDAVWQAGPRPADPDLAERMRTYLEYRIGQQILFFELGAEKFERTERSLSAITKATVAVGIAVALVYGTRLATGPSTASPLTSVLALLAAAVPAVCNGVLAIQNLFTSQRLAASYLEARNELLWHENALRAILSRPCTPDAGSRFQSLALHVEATLGQELLRWKLLVERPEFDPAM